VVLKRIAQRKLSPHAWKSVTSFKPKIVGINQSQSNIVGIERIRDKRNANARTAKKAASFAMRYSVD
jgi:hypothetical protein